MKRLILLFALVPALALAQFAPGTWRSSGTLSVTGSAAINTMTRFTGTAFPSAWTNLVVFNPSAVSDIAVCPLGGVCTCAENGIAATNGDTILKSGGSWTYNFVNAIAIGTPSVVSCTGSAVTVEFSW